jgi:rubredoxin
VKPSERIERIMRLAQLANNASVSSHVTAALEHCVALFQELANDVEALKHERGRLAGHRYSSALDPNPGMDQRTAADDQSDPVHPLSQGSLWRTGPVQHRGDYLGKAKNGDVVIYRELMPGQNPECDWLRVSDLDVPVRPLSQAPKRFVCPSCGDSHGRGPVNGVDSYRCLKCGYVGRGHHPDPEIDAEVAADAKDAEDWDRAHGVGCPPAAPKPKRRECWLAEYEEDGVLCWGSCRFRHDLEKTCPPGTELHRMVELREDEQIVQVEETEFVVVPPKHPGGYDLRITGFGDVVLTAEQAERVRDLIAVVPRLRNVEVSDDEPVVEEILDAYSKLKVDDVAAFVGIEVDRERE